MGSPEKTPTHSTPVQRKSGETSFFRKAGEESFFGAKENSSTFFSPAIQTKLSVSSPDDPQEKEADAAADSVMRMSEPAGAAPPAEEKEEKVQTKPEGPVITRIQCKEEDKEEQVQTKLFRYIQRSSEDARGEETTSDCACSGNEQTINRKNISIHHSDVIQRSGRGPPESSTSFEHTLTSTKGGGSALPDSTKHFMESRFNADFSGVRIHTGTTAETMNRSVHAQAFTHGNDIYFNAGKYSPNTSSGGLLLAHELTHTIQQGASKSNAVSSSPTTIARKNIIQRASEAAVPQLANAVQKAKSMEGKINAKKPGPDGYRTGWEHLLDIFKSAFGEDKIISGAGGTIVPGTVAEMDIKKYREAKGVQIVDPRNTDRTITGDRDAMPSWCGIFVMWALNKSGVPMPKWQLGKSFLKPEAILPTGASPSPGDIAWRRPYSHFAMVEKVSGDTITTVNGNTAGEDNMGGQVQSKDHPMDNWDGFYNPLILMEGTLGSGEGPVNAKPKTMEEIRKELKNVNRKEENDQENENAIQTKPELSNWSVDASGTLNTGNASNTPQNKVQTKEEKKEEDEQQSAMNPPTVQKKQDYALHCKGDCNCENENTVQAKFAVQRQTEHSDSSLNSYTSAEPSEMSAEQDRGPPVQAKLNGGNDVIQRDVLDDALQYVGSISDCIVLDLDEAKACGLEKAQNVALHIPGYKALRVVLGSDPITGDHIDRNGRNFIEAAFDIMPGGMLLHQKLDEQHQLDAAAAWIDGKIGEVETLVNDLFSSFDRFWNDLGVSDFTSPMDVIRDGLNIVLGFIDSIIEFAKNAAIELLEMVKEFLLSKIVEFIKERTTIYPLLCVILEHDPITEVAVERNGTNILNALLEFGGEQGKMQRDQMIETGTFEKVVAYIDEGIAVFGGAYDEILAAFKGVWDIVTIDSLMDPVETFGKIYDLFAGPIGRVLEFVGRVAEEILKLIKEVLFKRISTEARKIRGYYLVTVIINEDPFTKEVVDRSVENIIHGFMSLMDGGEEQFQQMKESGAIAKAVNKINAAVKRLNMTPEAIVGLFMELWESFKLEDFLHPIETFQRIIATFGEPIGRLIAFVIEIVKIVVEVILIIMNFPFDLINNIIAKAMLSFDLIKRDPIGFLKNLLRSIKEGFIQFFDNIIKHLIGGVVGWLTSELKEAGVPPLPELTLQGIIGWVLEILGISMEKIWEKLAAHPRIGPEKVAKIRSVVNTLEGIWTFIKDVQERGMAAIWDKIQEQLTNLWTIVLDAVKNWILEKIITVVVTKLLSFLDPTGIMAVINSCIALYKAVQSFIKYLREMLEVVNSFVEGVAEIAQGNTKKAADFLEATMARAMPIVIGFLANQVGLTGIGRRVGEMIEKIREMVDKALTWLVNKAVDTGFAILDRVLSLGRSAVGAVRSFLGLEETYTNEAGETHTLAVENVNGQARVKRASGTPEHISVFLNNMTTNLNSPTNTMTPEKKAEVRAAIAEANNIVNSIQAISYPENAPDAEDPHIQQRMNQLLSALKRQVQIIDKTATPVPPVSVVPGFSSNLASNLEIKYLMKGHHPPGTPASDYEGEMHGATPVLRTIGLLPLKWVNFHMLNHNYGGLAVDSNLVPTPKSVNNGYKDTFEESFKGFYDHPTTPEVMWFSCSVTYRSGTVFAQSISSRGGAMKADGREWIPDTTKNITPWSSNPVPPPVAEAVAINRLPPTQDLIRQVARYTPMAADLLILLARIKPPVVTGRSTLLSVLATYARSGALDDAKHNTYIGQIRDTTFDFSR